MTNLLNKLYLFLVRQRQPIIDLFKLSYWMLGFFTLAGFLLSPLNSQWLLFFYNFGRWFGQASLLVFVVTLLPGMFDRIGYRNQFLSLLRAHRRYVGILMYFLAISHFSLVKLIFLNSWLELLSPTIYELMGASAVGVLFFLFITSNSFSLNQLQINWYRIHRLAYLGMIFIFLHVSLQSFSKWTILMGLVVVAQLISFVVVYLRTKSLTGGRPV